MEFKEVFEGNGYGTGCVSFEENRLIRTHLGTKSNFKFHYNKFYFTCVGKREIKIVCDFFEDEMTMTIEVGKVTGKRYFLPL
jgi:hypothetical protein